MHPEAGGKRKQKNYGEYIVRSKADCKGDLKYKEKKGVG
jgi:hypothetical protein